MTAPALARPARQGEPGYPGGRVYEHPITRAVVPSITAVDNMLAKDALKFWAARECAEYAATNWVELAKLSIADRVEMIRKAPWRVSGEAAADGDTVHDAIDTYIKTGQAPSSATLGAWSLTARRMWRAFTLFDARYRPRWVNAEFTVWSDRFGYAGTADWSAYIGSGLVLGDTKTGKSVYPEVGLQVSAIANADYILHPDGTQEPLPKWDRYAVLHVRPTYTRLSPLTNIPECFEAFKALRILKYWDDYIAPGIIGEAPKTESPLKAA